MFILNRTIPFISSFLIWLIWEFSFSKPKLAIFFTLVILLIVFVFFWLLFNRKLSKEFWQFFGLPCLFVIFSFLFSVLLLPNNLFKHIFILIIAFLFYLILENIFNFLHRPNIYQTNSIETFFNHLNLLILFFLSSSFYNLIFFLNVPFWLLSIFFFLIIVFLGFYFFWANKILNNENILYILIITIILAEFFWVVSFLPTNFYVNSLILTLIYYLMVVLSKYYILKILNKRVIRQYLIIAGAALLLTLITAQWR